MLPLLLVSLFGATLPGNIAQERAVEVSKLTDSLNRVAGLYKGKVPLPQEINARLNKTVLITGW
jgi:hypothetical protein